VIWKDKTNSYLSLPSFKSIRQVAKAGGVNKNNR
jgi:hypothetical protein